MVGLTAISYFSIHRSLVCFVLDIIPSSKHSKMLLICQDLQGFIRLSFIGSVGGFQYNATLAINSV